MFYRINIFTPSNFVKINCYEKSLNIYLSKKEELIILLKHNKLYTKEMMQLIEKIDSKLKKKINQNTSVYHNL